MKEAPSSRPLTMQSSPEEALAVLRDLRPQKGEVQSVFDFLDTTLFTQRFKEQWQYESNEKIWKGWNRLPTEALREATLQTLGKINGNAELFLHRGQKGAFSQLSHREVEEIKQKANLLYQYFGREL